MSLLRYNNDTFLQASLRSLSKDARIIWCLNVRFHRHLEGGLTNSSYAEGRPYSRSKSFTVTTQDFEVLFFIASCRRIIWHSILCGSLTRFTYRVRMLRDSHAPASSHVLYSSSATESVPELFSTSNQPPVRVAVRPVEVNIPSASCCTSAASGLWLVVFNFCPPNISLTNSSPASEVRSPPHLFSFHDCPSFGRQFRVSPSAIVENQQTATRGTSLVLIPRLNSLAYSLLSHSGLSSEVRG